MTEHDSSTHDTRSAEPAESPHRYGKITEQDLEMIALARNTAREALDQGGIPIAAVLVHGGEILAVGHNQRVQKSSVVLHGEMSALENAGRLPARIYRESTLYTTLSPCPMCSGAALLYGINRVVIGENRTFMGAEAHLLSQGVELVVVDDDGCRELLERFASRYPEIWAEDIGEDA